MTVPNEISAQQAKLEKDHVARVEYWCGRCGQWTLRAAALRKEREELEKDLTEASARMVMDLVRFGYSFAEAETRVERLLEQAFTGEPA